ncbi:Type II secretion system protein E [Desulfosarcina cetonica]|uniref:GspE/PulE family protein n=1 Tax=Desulfosarcina cetonica TaxID=90730 RepID=UPI0006D015C1|nr:GspE/PulE family protein [Desulfosarcina cetonica]VTR66193.1 Type II secretion system protein E [Desulfosarcina cetonica]
MACADNEDEVDVSDVWSSKRLLAVLEKSALISFSQARDFYANRFEMIQQYKRRRGKSGEPVIDEARDKPFLLIDAIVSLNLKRRDNPSKTVDEDSIFQALAASWNIPFVKVDPLKLDLNLVTTTIPISFAKNHLVLPIGVSQGELTVATPNPFNHEVFDDIARASQLRVNAVVSPRSDIIKLIEEFFGFKRSIAAAEHQFSGPTVDLGNLERFIHLKSADELPSNDQHVVNAVNHLFVYAFDQKASDIHIEPKRAVSLVRIRIDGVLHTVYRLPKNVHSAIVSRIKNLSGLDMAEKRRPQDGRIKTGKNDVEVEIRVSTIPVAFGEKVVMRIMDPDILFQDLEHLGFSSVDMAKYNQIVSHSHGLVLVCGPTGSGKSTTLYSTLRKISTTRVNVTTIEDPIEMVHEDFNQIAVKPQLGITFGSIMRNILRQDPDIIMVGELRDLETAENAIQAALTGHLVLSTLHTNDAPSSIIRLMDLGVPSFLIQATLRGILSQRLVRKICNNCKEKIEIDASALEAMGLATGRTGRLSLYQGQGCQKCRQTGYSGRTTIHEVLPFSDTIKALTVPDADLAALTEGARAEGMISLRESAIERLMDGTTTYQEVLRVTSGGNL